jgi:hypothetical protein
MKKRLFIPLIYVVVTSIILFGITNLVSNLPLEYKRTAWYDFVLGISIFLPSTCLFYALFIIFCPTSEIFGMEVFFRKKEHRRLRALLGWRFTIPEFLFQLLWLVFAVIIWGLCKH